MIRQRIRIRFCKQGDLRWISHRDLARVFERLFRRADLKLGMSEGFHPKPRMSFPLALGLGISAREEVMEFELAEVYEAEELRRRLNQQAPPGMEISELRLLGPGEGKAQAARLSYQIEIPQERRAELEQAVPRLLAQTTLPVQRAGRSEADDLRSGLAGLELVDGALRFTLAVSRQVGLRPRDVLAALGLDDLERHGAVLERTEVVLRDDAAAPTADPDPCH